MTEERTKQLDAWIRQAVMRFWVTAGDLTPEDEIDMRQEAWLKVLQRQNDYPEETQGRGLVCKLAEQACRDYERAARKARGEKVEVGIADILDTVEEPTVDPDQEFAASLSRITVKIAQDEREAAVGMLLFYHQFTVPEIAKALGLTDANVRSIVYRLRVRAKDLLGVETEVTR